MPAAKRLISQAQYDQHVYIRYNQA